MSYMFNNQDSGRKIYKHKDMPVYITNQFNFYRCVEFNDTFYNKTASVLHEGNLRESYGRYANLFPGQKVSYWANSPDTALAEIKKHGSGNNVLTFWAYDDATSTFPTTKDQTPLIIIDGRRFGVQDIIEKVNKNETLSTTEETMLQKLLKENPDCVIYESHAKKGGQNYIFFEKGFRKLSLREIKLSIKERGRRNCNKIICAITSDYSPCTKGYGEYFSSIAKVKMDNSYLETDEYLQRTKSYKESLKAFQEAQK